MKKQLLTGVLALGLVVSGVPSAFAAKTVDGSHLLKKVNPYPYVSDILALQPDVSMEDLLADVKAIAENTGDTENAVLQQIYKELKADNDQGEAEKVANATGGSGGTVSVGTSSQGNFFYTDSQTAYLNHGHVGMYYSSGTIVESVPSAGVRTISTTSRLVDQGGACVKSVNTTSTNRTNAANWAYSRVGIDGYSYNFATNRSTSHYGDKNCSKLIWSAYMLNGGLDLDKDGGLGVYPRDVRDASQTTLIRNI